MTNRDTPAGTEERMRSCLLSTLLPAGVLCGLDTVRDCMKDEMLRPFIGHALLHEIMPSLGAGREVLESMAIRVCRELEEPQVAQPLALLLSNAVRGWTVQALPVLTRFREREEALPPCLCMGLSLLIMLFSGARREENGRYSYLKGDETCYFSEDGEILSAFSRLSCDMDPESLAYAALSDRTIWDRDLRDIPDLEEFIASQLRDLQLLGLRESITRAWKYHD